MRNQGDKKENQAQKVTAQHQQMRNQAHKLILRATFRVSLFERVLLQGLYKLRGRSKGGKGAPHPAPRRSALALMLEPTQFCCQKSKR
jgi:hypothetical protein